MEFTRSCDRVKLRTLLIGFISFHNNLHKCYNDSGEKKKCWEKRIEEKCLKYMEKHDIPGMSISINVKKKNVYHEAYGYQDLEKGTKASTSMRGNISSISRLICAQCMARLCIDSAKWLPRPINMMTDDVYQLVRELPLYYDEAGKRHRYPILIRWLFCGMAGLREPTSIEKYNRLQYTDARDATRKYFNRHLFEFKPGKKYQYSSVGADIAGVLIEEARKRPYVDVAMDEIRSMKLKNTEFHSRKVEEAETWAQGYKTKSDGTGETIPVGFINYSLKYPSEGLVSDVKDLCTFGDKYADMIEAVISEQSGLNDDPFLFSTTLFGSNALELVPIFFGIHSNLDYYLSCDNNTHSVRFNGLAWNVVQTKLDCDRLRNQYYHCGVGVGHSSVLMITMKNNFDTTCYEYRSQFPPIPIPSSLVGLPQPPDNPMLCSFDEDTLSDFQMKLQQLEIDDDSLNDLKEKMKKFVTEKQGEVDEDSLEELKEAAKKFVIEKKGTVDEKILDDLARGELNKFFTEKANEEMRKLLDQEEDDDDDECNKCDSLMPFLKEWITCKLKKIGFIKKVPEIKEEGPVTIAILVNKAQCEMVNLADDISNIIEEQLSKTTNEA